MVKTHWKHSVHGGMREAAERRKPRGYHFAGRNAAHRDPRFNPPHLAGFVTKTKKKTRRAALRWGASFAKLAHANSVLYTRGLPQTKKTYQLYKPRKVVMYRR